MKTTGKTPKNSLDRSKDYPSLLAEIKERIRSAQYEALKAVNKELVGLYWDIGRMIVERQRDAEGWGKAIAEQLSNDLRTEFPESAVFPDATSSGVSFICFTATTSECNHWLHKSAGLTIW